MGTKVTSSLGSVLEEPEIQKLQMQAKIFKENSLNKLNALKSTTQLLERQTVSETLHEMDSKSALSCDQQDILRKILRTGTDERAALANLIANLTLDTEENKMILKQLKKANASLTQELKECRTNHDETGRALGRLGGSSCRGIVV
ncbi:hypothetical protein Tco_1166521 [Tanacetum coccineum]